MGISRDHRRDRRDTREVPGVALNVVAGTWADPTGSYYEVTCDTGFDGELAYSCSVRIQRPNGDVFDRPSVIKQFGDWTIVWGQKYVLDEAISNGHKLQWNNLRGGSGFVWQRVKPEYSRYRGYSSAPKGSTVRTAPRAAGKAEYDSKTWNSWFGWHKKDRDGWEKWDKTGSEHVDEEDEAEAMHETQATTASDDAVDSATETAAIFGSASEADADGEKRDLPDQAVIETRWRPKLHPPPPPPRQIHRANLGYWNNEAVASRISLDIPHHRPKRESCRPGQHINGCVSYATAGDLKDVPIYDGTLERFDKDKNSGTISSRGALADFKQNVYVHGTVLHSSKVCLKDRLCFRVHMNAHGKPQASRPLLRLRANEGYALSGTFTVAAAHSGIAGTIHCQSVSQLFDEDVQVSHEVGRQLQTGDRVNFNARWIYEDNDGKLEASEVQCEDQERPGPPPGLPGAPETTEPEDGPFEDVQAPPGLGVTEPTAKPKEESFDRSPPNKEAPQQGLRDSLELIGAGLAQDLEIEQVIHL